MQGPDRANNRVQVWIERVTPSGFVPKEVYADSLVSQQTRASCGNGPMIPGSIYGGHRGSVNPQRLTATMMLIQVERLKSMSQILRRFDPLH
jgi:hypothetical protein